MLKYLKKENNMKLQREMTISTLEQMCDLMCGGIEEDYEEFDMHEIYDEKEDE